MLFELLMDGTRYVVTDATEKSMREMQTLYLRRRRAQGKSIATAQFVWNRAPVIHRKSLETQLKS